MIKFEKRKRKCACSTQRSDKKCTELLVHKPYAKTQLKTEILAQNLQRTTSQRGLESTRSKPGREAGPYEHGNRLYVSIKGGEFLGKLNVLSASQNNYAQRSCFRVTLTLKCLTLLIRTTATSTRRPRTLGFFSNSIQFKNMAVFWDLGPCS
jgi:hypothetical protein